MLMKALIGDKLDKYVYDHTTAHSTLFERLREETYAPRWRREEELHIVDKTVTTSRETDRQTREGAGGNQGQCVASEKQSIPTCRGYCAGCWSHAFACIAHQHLRTGCLS